MKRIKLTALTIVLSLFSALPVYALPENSTIGNTESQNSVKTSYVDGFLTSITARSPILTSEKVSSATRDTVILLDNSKSMQGKPLTVLKDSAIKFCNSVLSGGNNRIAAIIYDSGITSCVGFTDNIQDLTSVISSMDASGSWTNINAALSKADELLCASDAGTKNIVIMTDGIPTAGEHSVSGIYSFDDYSGSHNGKNPCYEYANSLYSTASALLDTYNIYTLGFFHSIFGNTKEFAGKLLNDIQNTGYFEVSNADGLEFSFMGIANDILKKSGTFKYNSIYGSGDAEATYYYDDSYFLSDASHYNSHLATMSLCFELSAWPSSEGTNWTTDINDPSAKFKNVRDLLIGTGISGDTGLGFSNFAVNSLWGIVPTADSFGVAAAMKPIKTFDGTDTLIAVGLRGGGYGREWCSNFTLGKTGQHQGFSTGRQIVLDFLSQYIKDNNISGNVKLWVVGYSRGAAIANMVAGTIDDGYQFPNGVTVDKKDLYAYTFETPKGAIKDDTRGDYSNIHNIINPNDLVTLVAPSAWDFARYNDDIYLPSGFTCSNFEEQRDMMLKQLATLEGGPDPNDPYAVYKIRETTTQPDLKIDAAKILSSGNVEDCYWWEDSEVEAAKVIVDAVNYLANDIIGSRAEYAANLEQGVRDIFADMYGGDHKTEAFINSVINDVDEDELLDLLSPIWAVNLDSVETRIEKAKDKISNFVRTTIAKYDLPVSDEFVDYLTKILLDAIVVAGEECLEGNTDHINLVLKVVDLISSQSAIQAHYPEVCLAWLMSQDSYYNGKALKSSSPASFRSIQLNSPANINVYDSDGDLVASIIDNQKQNTESGSIIASVNSAGEKTIYLPCDDSYKLSITATDSGTLSYSVNEINLNDFKSSRMVAYNISSAVSEEFSAVVPKLDVSEIPTTLKGGSDADYPLFDSNNTEMVKAIDVRFN